MDNFPELEDEDAEFTRPIEESGSDDEEDVNREVANDSKKSGTKKNRRISRNNSLRSKPCFLLVYSVHLPLLLLLLLFDGKTEQ